MPSEILPHSLSRSYTSYKWVLNSSLNNGHADTSPVTYPQCLYNSKVFSFKTFVKFLKNLGSVTTTVSGTIPNKSFKICLNLTGFKSDAKIMMLKEMIN